MPVLRRPDLICREAVALVTDYLDGSLSRRDRRRFESHIRNCRNCSTYLAQIRQTIALTGTVEADDLPPKAQDELVELYRRWRSDR